MSYYTYIIKGIRFLHESQKNAAEYREETGGYLREGTSKDWWTNIRPYIKGRPGTGQGGRNTWHWERPNNQSDSHYIWHTHPSDMTGYPSKEDIWKVLNNSNIWVSFLITFKGIWQFEREADAETAHVYAQDHFFSQYREARYAVQYGWSWKRGRYNNRRIISSTTAFDELADCLIKCDACIDCGLSIKYTSFNRNLYKYGYNSDYADYTAIPDYDDDDDDDDDY